MPKLYFASLVTLSLLFAMALGVFLAAMVAMGTVDLPTSLALTVVLNLVIFAVSPWLTDLMLKWIHGLVWLEDADLKRRYPHIHALVQKVARQHGFTVPTIGFIDDRNPTAFTYGILRNNARIVVTKGIFEFLNEDEQSAVVAHELGHIVNRDFLVMTIAGMLVQMLYQIYAAMRRASQKPSSSKKDNRGGLIVIAVAAYIAYLAGTYILLYLSRTREYLADAFSAEHVEARHLSNALVKIAYGIALAPDTEGTRELLASTRHMGVVDFKGARYLGLSAAEPKSNPEKTAEAMLFDIYNPWAGLVELSSTHPLTGKRIQALGRIAKEKHQRFDDIDVEGMARRVRLDPAALRSKFYSELTLLLWPILAAVAVLAAAYVLFEPAIAVLALPAAGLAWIATIPRRYPFTKPAATAAADLMADYAASPIVGRPVRLKGEVIGRADAGSAVGEDTIFADASGRMILDFRSMLGPLGDLWTGWRRIKAHVGQKGEAEGWFRRGIGGHIVMSRLETGAGTITAKPYLAGIMGTLITVGFIALVVLLISMLN